VFHVFIFLHKRVLLGCDEALVVSKSIPIVEQFAYQARVSIKMGIMYHDIYRNVILRLQVRFFKEYFSTLDVVCCQQVLKHSIFQCCLWVVHFLYSVSQFSFPTLSPHQ
jgi:hypothetical protein